MAHYFAKWHLPRFGNKAAISPKLSNDFRVFLVAVDQMNDHGHAHFGQGDLAAALPDIPRKSLYNAITALVTAGMLAPGSGVRKLVVSVDQVSHDMRRRGKPCPQDCDGLFYSDGEWHDGGVIEQTLAADANWARSIRSRAMQAA